MRLLEIRRRRKGGEEARLRVRCGKRQRLAFTVMAAFSSDAAHYAIERRRTRAITAASRPNANGIKVRGNLGTD